MSIKIIIHIPAGINRIKWFFLGDGVDNERGGVGAYGFGVINFQVSPNATAISYWP